MSLGPTLPGAFQFWSTFSTPVSQKKTAQSDPILLSKVLYSIWNIGNLQLCLFRRYNVVGPYVPIPLAQVRHERNISASHGQEIHWGCQALLTTATNRGYNLSIGTGPRYMACATSCLPPAEDMRAHNSGCRNLSHEPPAWILSHRYPSRPEITH
jgi:hypothetical protein